MTVKSLDVDTPLPLTFLQISKLIEENRRLAAKASADARAAEQKMAKMQNELSKQR